MHSQLRHPGPPSITLVGGRLWHEPLVRSKRVSDETITGSCLSLTQKQHYKNMNATDFDPGDINLEEDDVDETEALYDDLARHYAQHGLKDPEGYFDSADEEVQEILSSGYVTE